MAKVAARDLRKEEVWRRLARPAESGQSVRSGCREQRVTETAFYWWRKELARRAAEHECSLRRIMERGSAGRRAAAYFVSVR